MADAPTVRIRIPGLLTRYTGGERTLPVQAETVAGAVESLLEAYPALAPHLLDGPGEFRAHLQLFLNGTPIGPLENAAVPVEAGDEIVTLQAVSGGRGGRWDQTQPIPAPSERVTPTSTPRPY